MTVIIAHEYLIKYLIRENIKSGRTIVDMKGWINDFLFHPTEQFDFIPSGRWNLKFKIWQIKFVSCSSVISAALLALDGMLQLGRTTNGDKTKLIITWRRLPLDFTHSVLKVTLLASTFRAFTRKNFKGSVCLEIFSAAARLSNDASSCECF